MPVRPRRCDRSHGDAVLLLRPRDAVHAGRAVARLRRDSRGPGRDVVGAGARRPTRAGSRRRQAGDCGRLVTGEPPSRARLRRLGAPVAAGRLLDRAQPLRRPRPDVVAPGQGEPHRGRAQLREHRPGEEREGLRRLGRSVSATRSRSRALDGRRRALRPEHNVASVHDRPDPPLRDRDRRPGRAALVHPGEPDRLGGRVRREVLGPGLRQLHGHGLHRRRRRGAVDVRQPAAADRGLPRSTHRLRRACRGLPRSPTSSGRSPPSISRAAPSGSASTTPAAIGPERRRSTAARSHETAAGPGLGACTPPRLPRTRLSPAPASTATTRVLAVANGVAHPIWTDTRDLAALGEEIYTDPPDRSRCTGPGQAVGTKLAGEAVREVVGDLVEGRQRTPSCPLMCSISRSSIRITCGRPAHVGVDRHREDGVVHPRGRRSRTGRARSARGRAG